jgi:Na+-translocating ferredoxin:NAD+ oxidoreductase RnfG subunit
MSQALLELVLFASKSIILFLFIFALLVVFFALVAKNRGRQKGQLTIKNLNKKFREESEELLAEIYPKKLFKNYLKDNKAKDKALKNLEDKPNSVYVLDFQGDIIT